MNIDITPILEEITSQSRAFSLDFSKLIFDEVMESRDALMLHDIEQGIEKGDAVPFAKRTRGFNYMGSKENLTDQCGFNQCDSEAKFSTKLWDTHKYNCEEKLCLLSLETDFARWWKMNCKDLNPKNDADVKGAFIDFLVDLKKNKLIDSLWTKIWFVSRSYGNSSNLYGSDGLMVQMLAAAQVGSEQRIEIPENAKTTYADQMSLDAERGYNVFNSLNDKALEMQLPDDAPIKTTRALALNYLQYLRKNNQVDCCFKSDTTERKYVLDNLNIYGRPIEVINEFDMIIQGTDDNGTPYFPELNDGTKYTDPHRAFVTYKENLPVGTCSTETFDNVEIIYDRITRNTHLRSEYHVGAMLLRDKHLVLAV